MVRRSELDPQDEIVRLLVTQLRLELGSQAATIAELSKAGFGLTRIAELLGTTPGTVNVALQRSKKAASRKQARGDEA